MSALQRPVSRLGFGVSGAHGTPLVRRSNTIALIEQAAAQGVSVFDTAPAYGNGEAERRLGSALKRLDRDGLHVMTKAGLASHGLAGRRRDFSPDSIEASVRTSLRRLGLDGVDTLFLHGPDPAELTHALFQRLGALQRAGAFRTLGVAGRGGELDAAINTGQFGAVMAPVHPYLDGSEVARLQAASNSGLTVFAIETAGDAPARRTAPRSAADLYKLVRSLRGGRAGRGRTEALKGLEAACELAWVDCALMTTTRPAHLEQAIATGRITNGPQ